MNSDNLNELIKMGVVGHTIDESFSSECLNANEIIEQINSLKEEITNMGYMNIEGRHYFEGENNDNSRTM